jgi:predicted dehydrogenase
MAATKVGVIGCGNISGAYFRAGRTFEAIDIVACADLIPGRAREKAEEFGVPRACGVDELLADGDLDIVINLTIPKAHAEVGMQAVAAGKNVYGEKPLTITREEGRALLQAADDRGLRVGCAPDTFLGAGIQTCRKLIDDGAIGEPVAATAFMMCRGHESWHPDPAFYYQVGGGPMFDMGPYYLTALVNLLGPMRRVTGSARKTFPRRTITSEPKRGTPIDVEVPTHVAGVIDFASGAVGTIITSFDVCCHHLPCIEVHGSQGSIQVPDPNGFGGNVLLRRAGEKQWADVPHTHGYADNSRGIGAADMAVAIRTGRDHRASGRLAFHVLDAMHAFHDASAAGRHVELSSTCERPAALPVGLSEGRLDD